MAANPFTTLQVALEPAEPCDSVAVQRTLTPGFLNELLGVCLESPTYLDKFYALLPGRPNGAKRLVVVLPLALRACCDPDWIATVGEFATVVWRCAGDREEAHDLEPHEESWIPARGGSTEPRIATPAE